MKQCHKCGAPWVSEKRQPGVKEYCEKCSAYLHCCLNCRFHDKSRPNQCQIPNTEAVADRAGANFCDEFEFADRQSAGPAADKKEVRKSFDSLFGDNQQEPPGPGLDDFTKLFGD